ncbi:uncharacterized protein LOC110238278 [Exaiptasia diaphana]|uniref:Uncharacterized protein n=1 Tax=Exaiptasia diaphana TaxID=2652724 RepID=A0A913X685_EXADI|nr:uncharacterized protein LOC110238278 [Exaiptasia diaphana]
MLHRDGGDFVRIKAKTMYKVTVVMVIILLTEMVACKPGKLFISKASSQSSPCCGVKREILWQRLGHMYNPSHVTDSLDDNTLQATDMSKSLAHDSMNLTSRSLNHRSVSKAIYTPDAWTCKATYKWIDLGSNYFPRYHRSASCSKNTCWFGHYRCVKKYFHLKFLKRKPVTCQKVQTCSGVPRFEDFWDSIDKKIPLYCACVN